MNAEIPPFKKYIESLSQDLAAEQSLFVEKIKKSLAARKELVIQIRNDVALLEEHSTDFFEPELISIDMEKIDWTLHKVKEYCRLGNNVLSELSEFFGHQVTYDFAKEIIQVAQNVREDEDYEDQINEAYSRNSSAANNPNTQKGRVVLALKRLYLKSKDFRLSAKESAISLPVSAEKLLELGLGDFDEEQLSKIADKMLQLGSTGKAIQSATRGKINWSASIYNSKTKQFEFKDDSDLTDEVEKMFTHLSDNLAENKLMEAAVEAWNALLTLSDLLPFNIKAVQLKRVFRNIFIYKENKNGIPGDLNPYFFERYRQFFRRKTKEISQG